MMIKKVLTGACLLLVFLHAKSQNIFRALEVFSSGYKNYSVFITENRNQIKLHGTFQSSFKNTLGHITPFLSILKEQETKYNITAYIKYTGYWWNVLNSRAIIYTKVIKGPLLFVVIKRI